ncbi:MAG: bifunctional folylpolyglutamate synthase/dihydrofolate synthase, partial [Alphaproteobacteria bacterium]
VSVDGHASHAPRDLVAAASDLGIRAEKANSVHDALKRLADPPGARVLICGSLFLAGNFLGENGTPPK